MQSIGLSVSNFKANQRLIHTYNTITNDTKDAKHNIIILRTKDMYSYTG